MVDHAQDWPAQAPVSIPQWGERRGFERVYKGNPFAQQRLAKALYGLLEVHIAFGDTCGRRSEVAPALRTVLTDFMADYPEFLTDHSAAELDKDLQQGDYSADRDFVDVLRAELEDHVESGNQ